jgi:hypothetical protein
LSASDQNPSERDGSRSPRCTNPIELVDHCACQLIRRWRNSQCRLIKRYGGTTVAGVNVEITAPNERREITWLDPQQAIERGCCAFGVGKLPTSLSDTQQQRRTALPPFECTQQKITGNGCLATTQRVETGLRIFSCGRHATVTVENKALQYSARTLLLASWK